MCKKIKGIIGSKKRADEVLKWLIEQGAESASVELLGGDNCNTIYYVNKRKQATWVNAIHSELFDIVELPRWRAGYKEKYYYISECGEICCPCDVRAVSDNKRFNLGNYFKTKEEAKLYVEKIHEIFKEAKEIK